jgi:hypothetical protein
MYSAFTFQNPGAVARARASADPLLWTEIGTPSPSPSRVYAAGAYTVQGVGSDLWFNYDECYFGSVEASGDHEVIVRVTDQDNTHPWAKAGIMFRESYADNSKHVFLMATPGYGVAFQYRTTTNGATTDSIKEAFGTVGAPRWLKMTMVGDVFTAYKSTDGLVWTTVGSVTLSMNAAVRAGLVANSVIGTCEVGFDSLSIEAISGAPVEEDVPSIVLYVATDGNDSTGDGSEGSPYLTLGKARDRLRAFTGRTVTGGTPAGAWDGAWIVVKAGTYYQSTTLELDNRDMGTLAYPVKVRAEDAAEVRVLGSELPTWTLIDQEADDSWAWARLSSAARSSGKVYRARLSGVTFTGGGDQSYCAAFPRVTDGSVMRKMSRWPAGDDDRESSAWVGVLSGTYTKSGVETYVDASTAGEEGGVGFQQPASATVDSSVPLSWDYSGQVGFYYGVLEWPYYCNWARISSAQSNGGNARLNTASRLTWNSYFPPGYGGNKFIAVRNMLEALTEGTYCWRTNGSDTDIYYWSASGVVTDARVTRNDLLVKLGSESSDASAPKHLHFQDIQWGDARSYVFRGWGCDNIQWVGGEVRNWGGLGIDLLRSNNIVLDGCDLHDGAVYGIRLHGGDYTELADSGNELKNLSITEMMFDLNANIIASICDHKAQLLPYQVPVGNDNSSCGLSLDNVLFEDIRDGAVTGTGSKFVADNVTFRRTNTLTVDSGCIGGAAGRFHIPGNVVRNTLFDDIKHHPRQVQDVYTVYVDNVNEWLFEDCIWRQCPIAMTIHGINIIVRRGIFEDCSGGAIGAAIGIVNRDWLAQYWVDNVRAGIQLLDYAAVPSYAYLEDYLVGGPKENLILKQGRPVVVDCILRNGVLSASTERLVRRSALEEATTLDGYPIGFVDTQLNYPFGTAGTPTEGGGTQGLDATDSTTGNPLLLIQAWY